MKKTLKVNDYHYQEGVDSSATQRFCFSVVPARLGYEIYLKFITTDELVIKVRIFEDFFPFYYISLDILKISLE